MSTSITLIQLVSEQTVQNLLPVLRFRPSRLIHIATRKTKERASLVATMARERGVNTEVELITLSTMPSIRETKDAIGRAISAHRQTGEDLVLNFTGGTKLMSIGGYVAAMELGIPSLYVDTFDGEFVDGRTGKPLQELVSGDLNFASILPELTVDLIARANGCAYMSAGRDWQPFLPLARHLSADNVAEEELHSALFGPDGLFPSGREPRKAATWLKLLDLPFTIPDAIRPLAIEAGLLRAAPDGDVMLPDTSREDLEFLVENENQEITDFRSRYFRAVQPMQQSISFLTGGWWEVAILDRMVQTGRFRDLRWSVATGETDGSGLEEDIVALDGVQVVYVSCKRGGSRARLLPQLDELNARAIALGGTFTRRFLAVHHVPSGAVKRSLQQRAKLLGVGLVFGDDLESRTLFQ